MPDRRPAANDRPTTARAIDPFLDSGDYTAPLPPPLPPNLPVAAKYAVEVQIWSTQISQQQAAHVARKDSKERRFVADEIIELKGEISEARKEARENHAEAMYVLRTPGPLGQLWAKVIGSNKLATGIIGFLVAVLAACAIVVMALAKA